MANKLDKLVLLFNDLDDLDDEVDFKDKEFKKKFIEVEIDPEYDLLDFLDEGLKAIRAALNEDLTKKRAMFRVYRAMRPFEEFDYKKGNPALKNFADDKTIDAFWDDMSSIVHCTKAGELKTKMTLKGSFFVLLRLARDVLDKDDFKETLESNGFDFERFGKNKIINCYLEKHKGKVIKLRK